MKLTTIALCLIFSAPVAANTGAFLCGDPPPVDEGSLKGELDGQANFLSKFIGDAKLRGKIEASRSEIFSKYPNAEKLVVDHYLLYQTCAILMEDGTMSTPQKLEELRATRREFKEVSSNQRIAGTCRHKDFGVERWANDEVISGKSGWGPGGTTANDWCRQLIGNTIHSRSIGPFHKVTIVNTGSEGRWTWDRHRQYNYSCEIRVKWNPVFNERQDASRCGSI